MLSGGTWDVLEKTFSISSVDPAAASMAVEDSLLGGRVRR
jgi:hypothetical protein